MVAGGELPGFAARPNRQPQHRMRRAGGKRFHGKPGERRSFRGDKPYPGAAKGSKDPVFTLESVKNQKVTNAHLPPATAAAGEKV